MKGIFKKMVLWWQSLRLYVLADPSDNSMTLSRKLFGHIRENADGEGVAKVLVFSVSEDGYAFIVNPKIDQKTQMCDIQYNSKHKCIGFETLCPTVGRIFYDYGLPSDRLIRLSVCVNRTVNNEIYYQIQKPNGKHLGKYQKT